MNQRISAKERGLLKGAIRRVFSRSDLRKLILEESRINHKDESRPRVTKWSCCAECKLPTPTYLIQVDHIIPIVPIDSTLELMTWDDVVDRIWCDKNNLQPLCKPCHNIKTKAERKLRRTKNVKSTKGSTETIKKSSKRGTSRNSNQ